MSGADNAAYKSAAENLKNLTAEITKSRLKSAESGQAFDPKSTTLAPVFE